MKCADHRRALIAAAALGLAALPACSSIGPLPEPYVSPVRAESTRQADRSTASRPAPAELPGHKIAGAALSQVGAPYRYGGTSPAGFDCSGLVRFAYRQAGIIVPRTTGEQLSAATAVRIGDLSEGDLLFFRIGGEISHVAIYLGDGRFVHAPSSGKRVSIAGLSDRYWRERLVGAGRIS